MPRRAMRIGVVAALLAVAVAPVAAQPSLPPGVPALSGEPLPPHEEVSPGVALGLSLGATAGSWAVLGAVASAKFDNNHVRDNLAGVFAFGTLVAPTAGHWYARRLGSPGLIARAVGAGILYWTISRSNVARPLSDGSRDDKFPVVAGLGLGLGTYAVATVYDIIDAPRAARRYNQRKLTLPVRPLFGRGLGGNPSFGLAVAGRF